MPFFELEVFQILIVKDKSMNEIGILDNAYNIEVERTVNEVWQSSFSMPIDDPKNELCTHFNYVEIISDSNRNYGMYRIMPTQTKKSESDESVTYNCEHVFATLMDDVMEGYHQFTNYTTKDVIEAILDLQETKHWVIGQIDFTRYFHYSFENENGLLAPILSIPKPFNEPYEFNFDTTVYPWKLNLLRSSDEVKAEIRWGKDMISFDEVSDPTKIVNYIIPKGAGEGVNQLTIEDVNGGKRYLQDTDSIAKWGKRSYIWIDKRFEDAQSLKDNAQALLDQWKEPKIAFTCQSADVSLLPGNEHERKVLNGVTDIVVGDKVYQARIIGESINDLADEFNVNYEIANKLNDIATTTTDLERKQQVNDAYSQGATNINVIPYNENCDPNFPAVIEFPFPDDMVYVNEARLRIRTSPFRTHVKGAAAGGQYFKESVIEAKTTASGGGATTSAGGGQTTSSGGGSIETSGTAEFGADSTDFVLTELPEGPNYDNHFHRLNTIHIQHRHEVSIPAHTHTVSNHTHSVPNHTHDFSVTIPAINIPAHTHPMVYGIYEYEDMPTSLTVKIDGVTVPFNGLEGEIDITEYLRKENGKVTRDWHTVEVTPNDLARIDLVLINRFFCQSHVGGQY